jgi:hypothetical protein
MPLKAKQPEAIQKRLKLFMYGPAGSGKTTAAIQFPNAVIIDMEKGSQNYTKTIAKSKSVVLDTNNPDEVRSELKSLLTEKHEYKTLIIDPITSLYNGIQEKWTRIFEKYTTSEKQAELQDFGMRYWGRVKSEYKSIQRLLMALDMNVIITSHQKDIYGNDMKKIGVGPDSMKGDAYFFDYVFQLDVINGRRVAKTIKERAEINEQKFPESFEFSYANMEKFYGTEILSRSAQPVLLASPEQVAEINRLLTIVKINDAEINKWLNKADVEQFEEMKSVDIQKCIDYITKNFLNNKEK